MVTILSASLYPSPKRVCHSPNLLGCLGVKRLPTVCTHAQRLSSLLQILEAFAVDDSIFVQNCGRLMAMSSAIITMSHYEFHNICDTKLESIGQRIACYQEVGTWCPVSAYGSSAKWPLSKAGLDRLSCLGGPQVDFRHSCIQVPNRTPEESASLCGWAFGYGDQTALWISL